MTVSAKELAAAREAMGLPVTAEASAPRIFPPRAFRPFKAMELVILITAAAVWSALLVLLEPGLGLLSGLVWLMFLFPDKAGLRIGAMISLLPPLFLSGLTLLYIAGYFSLAQDMTYWWALSMSAITTMLYGYCIYVIAPRYGSAAC